MVTGVIESFASLPPLQSSVDHMPRCKICGGPSALFDAVDFYKHCSGQPYQFGCSGISVPYFRCGVCSFIFTDLIDTWTDEECARWIYNEDYMKVDPDYLGARALRTAADMSQLLVGCEDLRILDYGSGAGIFVDVMRSNDFRHIEGYDPYSSPSAPSGNFDLITCFEVIEHTARPLATFRDMVDRLSPNGAIIVGQSLQPTEIEEIGGRWWYVAPRNGHVSMYAEETFVALAEAHDLHYYRGAGIYGFARRDVSGPVERVITALGPRVRLYNLCAPSDTSAPGSGWHGVERRGAMQWRWTAAPEVVWPAIEFQSGVTMLHIPYHLEIRDGFARTSTVSAGDDNLVTSVGRHRIMAEVICDVPAIRNVLLRTAAVQSPNQISGSADMRPLGLAVISSVQSSSRGCFKL